MVFCDNCGLLLSEDWNAPPERSIWIITRGKYAGHYCGLCADFAIEYTEYEEAAQAAALSLAPSARLRTVNKIENEIVNSPQNAHTKDCELAVKIIAECLFNYQKAYQTNEL